MLPVIKNKNELNGFTCSTCGEYHEEIPMCFGANYPDYYFSVPPEERADRIEINQNLCVVDKKQLFIRGRIEIPVTDSEETFCWKVWTSLSEANFIKANTLWNDPDRVQEPPYFSWLQTVIPCYPNTLNIRTLVHTQQVGKIPQVEVIEENHPLNTDQQNGIKMQQVIEIVESILHQEE
jgi:hypothetical protein